MNYNKQQQTKIGAINVLDIVVILSLVNLFYLNFKLLWFGTTGETWFAIEPSTILMPLITAYAVIHMLANSHNISTKLGISIFLYLTYAALVTVFNFNHTPYKLIFAFISIVYWGCTIYIFYIYTQKNGFNNKIYKFAAFLFILLCAVFIYRYSFYKSEDAFKDKTLTLNNVYYILFLFPFMLFSKKMYWKYLAFGLTFLTVVLSQKRGALIILVLCAIIWLLFSEKSYGLSKFKNIFLLLVTGVVLYYFLSYFTVSYDLSITDRFMTLFNGEDTTGSGRSGIWETYLSVIGNDGLISLVGRGYDANVVSPKYNYLSWAHNDFLQIVFNYGFFGAILFLAFVINLFSKYRQMKKQKYEYATIFLISLLITFVNGLFGMCFVYPQWVLTSATLWGLLIGDFNRKTKQKNALEGELYG